MNAPGLFDPASTPPPSPPHFPRPPTPTPPQRCLHRYELDGIGLAEDHIQHATVDRSALPLLFVPGWFTACCMDRCCVGWAGFFFTFQFFFSFFLIIFQSFSNTGHALFFLFRWPIFPFARRYFFYTGFFNIFIRRPIVYIVNRRETSPNHPLQWVVSRYLLCESKMLSVLKKVVDDRLSFHR